MKFQERKIEENYTRCCYKARKKMNRILKACHAPALYVVEKHERIVNSRRKFAYLHNGFAQRATRMIRYIRFPQKSRGINQIIRHGAATGAIRCARDPKRRHANDIPDDSFPALKKRKMRRRYLQILCKYIDEQSVVVGDLVCGVRSI